jgi:hypothetical protein
MCSLARLTCGQLLNRSPSAQVNPNVKTTRGETTSSGSADRLLTPGYMRFEGRSLAAAVRYASYADRPAWLQTSDLPLQGIAMRAARLLGARRVTGVGRHEAAREAPMRLWAGTLVTSQALASTVADAARDELLRRRLAETGAFSWDFEGEQR